MLRVVATVAGKDASFPLGRDLKSQLHRHLPDSRRRGAGHHPKRTGAGVEVAIHPTIELRVVEYVEELSTKLEGDGLSQLHILQYGEVPVINSRPVKKSPASGTLAPER